MTAAGIRAEIRGMGKARRRVDPRLERSPARAARILRGFTVQSLSRHLDVSAGTIYRVEKGDAKPGDDDAEQAQKVIRFLGLEGKPLLADGWAELGGPKDPPFVQEVARVVAAGQSRSNAECFAAICEFSRRRGEPPTVVAKLADALATAPESAGLRWWFDRWDEALKGG